MSVIMYCQEMFHFELPSIMLQRRLEKNWNWTWQYWDCFNEACF